MARALEGEEGLEKNIALLAEMREKVGDDFWLMYDCWMSLDVDYATRLAHRAHEHGAERIAAELGRPEAIATASQNLFYQLVLDPIGKVMVGLILATAVAAMLRRKPPEETAGESRPVD